MNYCIVQYIESIYKEYISKKKTTYLCLPALSKLKKQTNKNEATANCAAKLNTGEQALPQDVSEKGAMASCQPDSDSLVTKAYCQRNEVALPLAHLWERQSIIH